MKAYFIRLFDYDRYANLSISAAMTRTNERQKAEELMAHLLSAQQIWLKRCKGEAVIGGVLWPDWKSDTIEEIINDNYQKWISWLKDLNDSDLDRVVSYKTLNGEGFENRLTDILAHVINHGTHHRAQAGQHLKQAGTSLPLTDYIFYLRDPQL